VITLVDFFVVIKYNYLLFLLFVFLEELFLEELFLEELLLFGHALLHCELFEFILTPPFDNSILILFLFVTKLLCMFFLIYEKLNINIVFAKGEHRSSECITN